MKRTLLITAAMLALFAVVLITVSGRVMEHWQQPRNDNVNLSTGSPAKEIISGTIKDYQYNEMDAGQVKNNKDLAGYEGYLIDYTDGMITTQHAANLGGEVMEKYFPYEDWDSIAFNICRNNFITPSYLAFYETEDSQYVYLVDAYTGQIMGFERINHKLKDVNAGVPVNSTVKKEDANRLAVRAISIANDLGYDKITKAGAKYDWSMTNYFGYNLAMETDGKEILMVSFYNNEQKNDPLMMFMNSTKTMEITENDIDFWGTLADIE